MADTTPAAPSGTDGGNTNKKEGEDDTEGSTSVVTQSFPPSHILQDGRFIYLPPPNEYERNRFFERSVAKFGLMDADMKGGGKDDDDEGDGGGEGGGDDGAQEQSKGGEKKDTTAPRVHPLAVASARLQTGGIAELNRAINLSMLVNTGEYFGLTNIVDPAVELVAASTVAAAPKPAASAEGGDAAGKKEGTDATTGGSKEEGGGGKEGGTTPAAATATAGGAATKGPPIPPATPTTPAAQKAAQEEQRIKNAYVLKRKRAVFDKASRVLTRHRSRLESAISAQRVPDQRLRQLRPQWRLVAPEHGTRAKPHATRPTEVVAIDVDVYDPTGGSGGIGSSLAGRLAAQVPRYATVELTEEYNNKKSGSSEDDDDNNKLRKIDDEDEEEGDDDEDKPKKKVKKEEKDDDAMDVDEPATVKKEKKCKEDKEDEDGDNDDDNKNKKSAEQQHRLFSQYTMAEPFAVADPTLGKTDFDPDKVTFLTLQFDIEKASTGFCMSSCLEPMTTTTIEKLKEEKIKKKKEDTQKEKQEDVENSSKDENKSSGGEEQKNESSPSTSAGEDGGVPIKKEPGTDPVKTEPGTDEEDGKVKVKEEKEKEEESEEDDDHHLADDEQVLVSLQHSLFCAKLFEAIRIEIMGEDVDEDESAAAKQQKLAHQQQQQQHNQAAQSHHSVVWLSSEQEENFLPPPAVMVRPSTSTGAPLCVVHCHASEVKVQMDSEYTLRAKLVEATADDAATATRNGTVGGDGDAAATSTSGGGPSSGSQNPAQLLVLCRSLLLHAQEAYHNHSLQESIAAAEKQREEEAKKLEAAKPRGLDRIQKKDVRKQPKILQSVVGLGTKMLFEQRIRKVLVRVRHWLKSRYPSCKDTLKSDWLSLSLFDQHVRFCLNFGNSLRVDVTIVRDEMTIITHDTSSDGGGTTTNASEGTSGAYRKVTFHSDSEFEIFLKIELRRQLKRQQTQQQQQQQHYTNTAMATAAAAAPIPVQ